MHGTWLSQCKPTQENLSKVRSLSQNALLDALSVGVEIRTGHSLVDIDIHADASHVLHFSDETYCPADVVIGSDGHNSVVRRWVEERDTATDCPMKQGSHCYISAIVNMTSGCPPFETLGSTRASTSRALAGCRFASIPMGGGCSFWFSSLPQLVVPDEVMCDKEKAKQFLLQVYSSWHEPIGRLIEATDPNHLLLEELPLLSNYTWNDTPFEVSSERSAAALLGDALDTATPNLAQGASLAIEDACDLAVNLKLWLLNFEDSREHDDLSLAECLEAYAMTRRRRHMAHRQMTKFTEMLSQMNGMFTQPLRNAMSLVPKPINSAIFDLALTRSMGGSEKDTNSAAMRFQQMHKRLKL